MICENNAPAVQHGDSGDLPNLVTGMAVGAVQLRRRSSNPAPVPAPGQPGRTAGAHLGAERQVDRLHAGRLRWWGVPAGRHLLRLCRDRAAATPYVGIGTSPGGRGYVEANANGGVDALGPAALLGLPGVPASAENPPHLNQPVVGVAASPSGDGYWTAASDGGVFQNGFSAGFFGSLGDIKLNKPVVGITPALDGQGYYMVASDGGVFPFGPGTKFQGSTGSVKLNKPIVAMAVDPANGGYWLVASDGGVFQFGNAPLFGSLGNIHLNKPIVDIMAAPNGQGYYLIASDGGIFQFGPGTTLQGSLGNIALNKPIVGGGLG